MQDFHGLDVWRRAHSLVLAIYQATQSMPREEVFGISMQLRRSSSGIATRIAEGCSRDSNVEFAVDLKKALAICNEVEYLILLSKDLEHLQIPISEQLTEETIIVRKMIFGLLRKF
jgi:four helix bundle protein